MAYGQVFDCLNGITKDEALEKHTTMWKAMQAKLGDNPSYKDRVLFKEFWTRRHKEIVYNNCYLCEYATQVSGYGTYYRDDNGELICCKSCPVDWPDGCCENGEICWTSSKISEILGLPVKE